MAGQRITKRVVDSLEIKPNEYALWDAQLPGFGIRVRPSGAMSYMVSYRVGSGRAAPKTRLTIGAVGKITPEQARTLAQGILGAVACGRDPARERRKAKAVADNRLRSIADNYLAREGGQLRTVVVRRATLERLVYPALGDRQIDEIKRSEINRLLDTIEDGHGPRMASLTLAYLRRLMNWHAARSDDFRSPIVRGMGRGVTTKRDRVLAHDELRAFWKASEAWEHPFSRLLRFILLTATRRQEAAGMKWPELKDGAWTIPAARYKTKLDFEVPPCPVRHGTSSPRLPNSPNFAKRRPSAASSSARSRPKRGSCSQIPANPSWVVFPSSRGNSTGSCVPNCAQLP